MSRRKSKCRSRRRLAFDLDETWLPLLIYVNAWYNSIKGTEVELEAFTEYRWNIAWPETFEDTLVYMLQFFQEGHSDKIRPLAGTIKWLVRMSQRDDLVTITARQLTLESHTLASIHRYLPGVFESVILCNHMASEGLAISKAEACQSHRIDWIIDDSVDHCLDCYAHGIGAIVYGEYPWNRNRALPYGIFRARNMKQVAAIVNASEKGRRRILGRQNGLTGHGSTGRRT